MARRWESILLLILLLISVFGCAARQLNPVPFQAAYANCTSSNLGQFSVYVTQSTTALGSYTIQVLATNIPSPGNLVTVGLVNSAGQPVTLAQGVRLNMNSTIYQGVLTSAELVSYSTLVIVPSTSQQISWLNQTDPNLEFCQLPSPTVNTPTY